MIRHSAAFAVAACLTLCQPVARSQERAEAPRSEAVVLLDAAHHNAWNDPRMTRFLENQGFEVRQLDVRFGRKELDGVDIVLIAGALSEQNAVPENRSQEAFDQAWRLPTPSAFTEQEISLLSSWVEAGGALMLVSDHMPLAGAIGDLAAEFGIEVSNGFAVDASALTDLSGPDVSNAGSIVFRRSDGTLAAHEVTDGRDEAKRVDTVATYVGSAFRLPDNGEALLELGPNFVSLLPEIAWRFSEDTAREPIGGWSQGGLLRVGLGRLAIFGELGILATPEALARDPDPDNPQKQNPQLLLNVLQWLSDRRD